MGLRASGGGAQGRLSYFHMWRTLPPAAAFAYALAPPPPTRPPSSAAPRFRLFNSTPRAISYTSTYFPRSLGTRDVLAKAMSGLIKDEARIRRSLPLSPPFFR